MWEGALEPQTAASLTTKPTSHVTSLAQREQIVTLAAAGWAWPASAAVGCSVRMVRTLAAAGAGSRSGWAGVLVASPALAAVVDHAAGRHRASRPSARPISTGARLIRCQLDLDGVTPLPSDMTVHAGLRRLGSPPSHTLRHKPLGWSTPAALPTEPV